MLRDGVEVEQEASFPLIPVVIGVQPQSAAMEADLQEGDVILAIDGVEITAFHELRVAVEASDGRELGLNVWRDGAVFDVVLAPRRMDLPLSGPDLSSSHRCRGCGT